MYSLKLKPRTLNIMHNNKHNILKMHKVNTILDILLVKMLNVNFFYIVC